MYVLNSLAQRKKEWVVSTDAILALDGKMPPPPQSEIQGGSCHVNVQLTI